jgi:predicted 2-oxoglutarate/Fe(II)-dependent dioxygenase YbiX
VLSTYGESFEPFNPHKTHIAKFEEGHGMHEHFDSSRPNDIATLVYLNDDYEGGEIYFPDYKISIKPEPGDLLCFPDQPRYVHGVKEIITGTRFTTPRWFTRIV